MTSISRWHFMGVTKCAECNNRNVECIQIGMKLACCFPTKCDHYKSTIQFSTSFYFHLYARMNFHIVLKLHDQDNVIIYLSIWHLYPITKVFQTQVAFYLESRMWYLVAGLMFVYHTLLIIITIYSRKMKNICMDYINK